MGLINALLSRLRKRPASPQPGIQHRESNVAPQPPQEGGNFKFDPFDSAFIENPYPLLGKLRREYPVYRCSNGSWVLSRYDDISAALKDSRLANSPAPHAVVSVRNRERYVCADIAQNIIPYMDAPAHTAARKVIARSFHQFLSDTPVDVPAVCRALLEPHAGQSVDLLSEVATPLCVSVTAHLFGLPAGVAAQLQPRYKSWSECFFYLFSGFPSEEVLLKTNLELSQCRDHFRQLIAERSENPGDDWLSRLLQEYQPGERDATQLADTCMLIMADAINADFGIANALLALAGNASLQQELKADPGKSLAAASELLRFDSPSLFIARRALEDIAIGGQTIRRNSGVLLMLASANRDETVFDQADKIILNRDSNPLLSFGRGEHACVGRQLVVRMVEATINVLLQQASAIELLLDKPVWELRAGHRWLKSLPVKLR
jgi:cytochrome P450